MSVCKLVVGVFVVFSISFTAQSVEVPVPDANILIMSAAGGCGVKLEVDGEHRGLDMKALSKVLRVTNNDQNLSPVVSYHYLHFEAAPLAGNEQVSIELAGSGRLRPFIQSTLGLSDAARINFRVLACDEVFEGHEVHVRGVYRNPLRHNSDPMTDAEAKLAIENAEEDAQIKCGGGNFEMISRAWTLSEVLVARPGGYSHTVTAVADILCLQN